MKSFNFSSLLADATDGSISARTSAAEKAIDDVDLEVEECRVKLYRCAQGWRDLVESVTGSSMGVAKPSVDTTVVPTVATLYTAGAVALGLELVGAGALALLLLNLPPVMAIAVGCLLALAYALIAKATITSICVRQGRPKQSLKYTTRAAIVSGSASLFAIVNFMIVRIGVVSVTAAHASLTAINVTLPIAAAAFVVMAWTESAPNRLARSYIKLESELHNLRRVRSWLLRIAKEAPMISEPTNDSSLAADSVTPSVDESAQAFNGRDREVTGKSLSVGVMLVLGVVVLGLGVTNTVMACDEVVVRNIQVAIDQTGSIPISEGSRVIVAVRNELIDIHKSLPCVRRITAYGWSSGWSATGDVVESRLSAPPDLENPPSTQFGDETSLLFKSVQRVVNAEAQTWRSNQITTYRAKLQTELEPVLQFLEDFDWNVSTGQTCLYQQLLSLSFVPNDTVSIVLTDGYQQNCGFTPPANGLMSSEGHQIVVVLLPSNSDGDGVLQNLYEREKSIRTMFPEATLLTWLSLNAYRTGWLGELIAPYPPNCSKSFATNTDGRCVASIHFEELVRWE